LAKFKFNTGDILIDRLGEVVKVTETYTDHHTYKSDYQIEVISPGVGMHRVIGDRYHLDRTIAESWYRETTYAEKVLYGR